MLARHSRKPHYYFIFHTKNRCHLTGEGPKIPQSDPHVTTGLHTARQPMQFQVPSQAYLHSPLSAVAALRAGAPGLHAPAGMHMHTCRSELGIVAEIRVRTIKPTAQTASPRKRASRPGSGRGPDARRHSPSFPSRRCCSAPAQARPDIRCSTLTVDRVASGSSVWAGCNTSTPRTTTTVRRPLGGAIHTMRRCLKSSGAWSLVGRSCPARRSRFTRNRNA